MPQLYDCGNIASNLDLDNGHELARFTVMYAKVSTRKHKKWEGDGLLICYANFAVLKTDDDKDVICRDHEATQGVLPADKEVKVLNIPPHATSQT
nr:SNF2-related domain containing protein [Haemonchus contortus]